jgi:hypothetical protein
VGHLTATLKQMISNYLLKRNIFHVPGHTAKTGICEFQFIISFGRVLLPQLLALLASDIMFLLQ